MGNLPGNHRLGNYGGQNYGPFARPSRDPFVGQNTGPFGRPSPGPLSGQNTSPFESLSSGPFGGQNTRPFGIIVPFRGQNAGTFGSPNTDQFGLPRTGEQNVGTLGSPNIGPSGGQNTRSIEDHTPGQLSDSQGSAYPPPYSLGQGNYPQQGYNPGLPQQGYNPGYPQGQMIPNYGHGQHRQGYPSPGLSSGSPGGGMSQVACCGACIAFITSLLCFCCPGIFPNGGGLGNDVGDDGNELPRTAYVSPPGEDNIDT